MLQVHARTGRQTPGVGTVTLTTSAGRLSTTEVDLDFNGTARVGLECREGEGGCSGFITARALWAQEGLEAVTIVEFIQSLVDAGGQDAQVPDAGPPDAGPHDAGSLDAGQPDAGRDAGSVDAGLLDAGLLDAGRCGAGGPDAGLPAPPSFDSREMLLMGTLSPGAFGTAVLCELSRPETAYPGFAGFAGYPAPALRVGRPTVRPSDGSLYYLSNGVLRRFVPDGVITQTPWTYPQDPEANDPVVPTPGCGTATTDSFLIRPDGSILHHCGAAWRDWCGAVVPICPGVVAFSEDGAAYCAGTRDEVTDPSGVVRRLTGALSFTSVRSKPGGGFWGVLRLSANWERWTISNSGVATKDGTFALPPPGTQAVNTDIQGWAHIDGFGNYYRWFNDPRSGISNDLVMKFSADFSTASVVYNEGDAGVMCRYHASNLVTGP